MFLVKASIYGPGLAPMSLPPSMIYVFHSPCAAACAIFCPQHIAQHEMCILRLFMGVATIEYSRVLMTLKLSQKSMMGCEPARLE